MAINLFTDGKNIQKSKISLGKGILNSLKHRYLQSMKKQKKISN
jgi:hypothetical protein